MMMVRVAAIVLITIIVLGGCDDMLPQDGAAPAEVTPPPPADPNPRSCPYERASSAGFNIEIKWEDGPYKDWMVAEVECAAAYWENAITGDLPDIFIDGSFFRETGMVTIEDLRVSVWFRETLGGEESDVMGLTTANLNRKEAPHLPYFASIRLRLRESRYRHDLGFLYNLARHEFGHAIGFDYTPAFYDLRTGDPWEDGLFIGPAAQARYGGPVPIDSGGHWYTPDLGRDVMWRTIGGRAVVTDVTLAAFQDIGYTVDFTMAGR